MIIFYLTTTAPAGNTSDGPLMSRTSRWWECSDQRLAEHGDYALAVSENVIVGVFRIMGWSRDHANDDKAVLNLEELPELHALRAWVSRVPHPDWKPDDESPFRYLSTRGAAFSPGQLADAHWQNDPVHDEIHFHSYL